MGWKEYNKKQKDEGKPVGWERQRQKREEKIIRQAKLDARKEMPKPSWFMLCVNLIVAIVAVERTVAQADWLRLIRRLLLVRRFERQQLRSCHASWYDRYKS